MAVSRSCLAQYGSDAGCLEQGSNRRCERRSTHFLCRLGIPNEADQGCLAGVSPSSDIDPQTYIGGEGMSMTQRLVDNHADYAGMG